MKALLDSSVLVAAMIESHPSHVNAADWVVRAKRREINAIVSAHTLAECYSVLTRIPPPQRISPENAWRAIKENVLSVMDVIALTADDYRDLLEHLSQNGIAGGVVYDGVIAWVAVKAQVDQVVTLNTKDFRRIHPAIASQLVVA
ncbi:MAG: PIN domain-containing protein [Blastocatellia bacterium]